MENSLSILTVQPFRVVFHRSLVRVRRTARSEIMQIGPKYDSISFGELGDSTAV